MIHFWSLSRTEGKKSHGQMGMAELAQSQGLSGRNIGSPGSDNYMIKKHTLRCAPCATGSILRQFQDKYPMTVKSAFD